MNIKMNPEKPHDTVSPRHYNMDTDEMALYDDDEVP